MNAQNFKNGVLGGLAGGVVFGMMMAMMGMLPMLASMVGSDSAVVGFLMHMMISAGIGLSYAVLLGGRIDSVGGGLRKGLGYGAFWWLLGPLTMMPLMMGMGLGVNWNLAAAGQMMPSLMGHLVFGAILGLVHFKLGRSKISAGERPVLTTIA